MDQGGLEFVMGDGSWIGGKRRPWPDGVAMGKKEWV
jgi:hypothetical protein